MADIPLPKLPNHPVLRRTSVVIKYTSSDGYRAEYGCKGGRGTTHSTTGAEVDPKDALIEAADELARIAAVFGFADEVREAVESAITRVKDWKGQRNG